MPYKDPIYSALQYNWIECFMLNAIDKDIKDCECHYQAPYGMVVMAGCPKHD